ncbi:MAG: hypothetical protein GX061_06455 [Eubacteriaceae bacterium]|nr:hypothetical protein [Eubacteriaceae bacterium]
MAIFQNQATLTYNGNVINSNVATGELQDVLTITKTTVTDTYALNDSVTYIVSIVNAGVTPYTGLTLTNDLGAYAFTGGTLVPLSYVTGSVQYYINGVQQTAPTVTSANNLVISGINIPANGNAMIIYEATVNQYAPLNVAGRIVNTGQLTGMGIATALRDSATIYTARQADLTISKSVSPEVVAPNGQLTYSFVIQNFGNTPATVTDDAVIRDTFNPILTNLTVAFNTNPWNAPANYTYNTATGLFVTNAGQITVPAATYTQDTTGGNWIITPGVSTLTVTGTIV